MVGAVSKVGAVSVVSAVVSKCSDYSSDLIVTV